MVRQEGFITKKYFADDCLTFCSQYLYRIETKFNQKYHGGTSACDTS